MDDKTLVIVKAGWAMFARYGFAKTTMSDIAAEAGVARQTVYNAFANKEELLRAVVRYSAETSFEEVTAAWEKCEKLEEKLAVFQQLGPLKWYEAVVSAPDAAELMDGVHKASSAELKRMEERWVALLADLIRPHVKDAQTAKETALFFYTTSKNAKYGVESTTDLKARLAVIHRATLALLS